jgi:hypothetical protein
MIGGDTTTSGITVIKIPTMHLECGGRTVSFKNGLSSYSYSPTPRNSIVSCSENAYVPLTTPYRSSRGSHLNPHRFVLDDNHQSSFPQQIKRPCCRVLHFFQLPASSMRWWGALHNIEGMNGFNGAGILSRPRCRMCAGHYLAFRKLES